MKCQVSTIFIASCKLKDIQKGFGYQGNELFFDFEKTPYSPSGILIWHILEDRIFLSEGLCRMMGMSKEGLLHHEWLFRVDIAEEFRSYLRNILDQVCSDEIADTTFKTRIPGIDKEIFGSVHLFDREDLGIMDLVVICWEQSQVSSAVSQ